MNSSGQSATPVDQMVTSPAFAVSAQGAAKDYMLLQAYAAWELFSGNIPDPQIVPESVSFADTVEVVQVQGFAAADNPVALTSAVGSSGTNYAVTPPPLDIQTIGQAVILSWSNPALSLQSSPTIAGTYTNMPGAASPYTNSIAGPELFFRLQGAQ